MDIRVRGVLFDLDGTLLDTLQDIADAANAALGASGFAPHPADAYRAFVGDGMETLIRRAAPAGTDAQSLDRVLAAMRAMYGQRCADKTRPYPGIMEMLAGLCERGLPLGVLSNKPHEFTVITVRHFFPGVPFACVQGSPPGGRAKPEPAMALECARRLNLAPAEIFFMGDSNVDMLTARNAGMAAVGVTWGFRSEEELLRCGARILLHAPEDIFEWV